MTAKELKQQLVEVRMKTEEYRRLNKLWRSWGYREAEGESGPMRQARSFEKMLGELPEVKIPGSLLVGSSQGALARELPRGITLEEYKKAEELVATQLNLPFIAHWDHGCPDYETLLEVGVGGILSKIREEQQLKRPQEELEYLSAMEVAVCAFQNWIRSLSSFYEQKEDGAAHAKRLMAIAQNPPGSFWEALQLVWLVDLALVLEERGAMAFGRMDQYLYPFYEKDLQTGLLTPDLALELLSHLFAKLEEPLRLNPINNFALAGLKPDGTDATNQLSYLLLEAAGIVRSPNHNLTARWHANTPKKLKEACFDLIATGVGFPSLVNDEILVQGLMELGYEPQQARDYCFVGCIETFFPGKTAPWADSRVNLLKVLEESLLEVRDSPPPTFDDFLAFYFRNLEKGIHDHARWVNQAENYDYNQYASPFYSALVEDCIGRGRDLNAGGAIHPAMHGIAGMGLATTADSLAAIRQAVYEEQLFSLQKLIEMLEENFQGYTWEREYLLNRCPKYGNGIRSVDELAEKIATIFGRATLTLRTTQGGLMLPLLAANIANIEAGLKVGASPDGRLACTPLSDAASPHFGRDKRGPAGVIDSLSQVDYINSLGGNVVNMKLALSPENEEQDRAAFIALITTYFRRGGLQMQFNTTDREQLLAAQKDPESYSTLVIRVSGFSAYFTQLAVEVQNDILARTEHRF